MAQMLYDRLQAVLEKHAREEQARIQSCVADSIIVIHTYFAGG
jgi:hypothetical protein